MMSRPARAGSSSPSEKTTWYPSPAMALVGREHQAAQAAAKGHACPAEQLGHAHAFVGDRSSLLARL
jgi:hypothetical protein